MAKAKQTYCPQPQCGAKINYYGDEIRAILLHIQMIHHKPTRNH